MAGNAGLWHDKFCDLWKSDWSGLSEAGKADWVCGLTSMTVGDREQTKERMERQRQLIGARSGRCWEMQTDWRLVTGLGRSHPVENGFAWDHTAGTPYIPGSSLKGLTRAWARDWSDDCRAHDIDRIFGPDQQTALTVGSVIFLDALPAQPVKLDADVMTPHYGPWYSSHQEVPADWHSPIPIPFLTVAPGQPFLFGVLPRRNADVEDCRLTESLVKEALSTLGAGAKTAVGYGVFVDPAAPFSSNGDVHQPTEPAAKPLQGSSGHHAPFVDNQRVEILSMDPGGRMSVRFLDSGDTEPVGKEDIEWKSP